MMKLPKNFEFSFLLILLFLAIFEPIHWPFFYPATTWGVMKGLLFLFFGWTFVSALARKEKILAKRVILLPILIFFLANLVSVLRAVDLDEALRSLSYLLIGILFFILSLYYLKKRQQLILFFNLILYLSFFVSFLSFITLLFQDFFKNLWLIIFPGDTVERYFLNLNRGRIEPLWAIQMGFPIIIYFLITQWKSRKRFLNFLIFALAILAIIFSNHRYQFFSAFLVSILYLICIKSKEIFLPKRFLFIFSLVLIVSGSLLSKVIFGRNILERLLFLDYGQDISPLVTRFNLAGQALEIFLAYPLFGIGLSNFPFYLTKPEFAFELEWFHNAHYLEFLYFETPHNIFLQLLAETGLVGFLAFVWLLRNFLKEDFDLLKREKNNHFKMIILAIILSSWVYIIDNLTSIVSTSAMNQVYFWFTRGMLAAVYQKKLWLGHNSTLTTAEVEVEVERVRPCVAARSDPKQNFFAFFTSGGEGQ